MDCCVPRHRARTTGIRRITSPAFSCRSVRYMRWIVPAPDVVFHTPEPIEENEMTRRELFAGAGGLTLTAAGPIGAAEPADQKAAVEAANARLAAAKRGLAGCEGPDGSATIPELARLWARRVVDAEFALRGDRHVERLAALEAYVRHARAFEKIARASVAQGGAAMNTVLDAEYHRADAEALLAAEKARQID